MTPISETPRPVAEKGISATEIAAACIPTTWLDPMLTGANAVVGNPPYFCPDIERLFTAIRNRILASSPIPEGHKKT